MAPKTQIKRFSTIDRTVSSFPDADLHCSSGNRFQRLFITTSWGRASASLFGGYEMSLNIHVWVGILMIVGFVVHSIYLLIRIDWKNLRVSIFGPDSLVPNLDDLNISGQQILWFFGMSAPPKLNRWAYWEKFDYWAVYWGLPLLAITGLMIMYPLVTSRILPGWSLNIAALLHRAEAILAVAYIFIVHFFIGHLRPTSFPMNEGMFAGSVPLEELAKEKPGWMERLKRRENSNRRKRPHRSYGTALCIIFSAMPFWRRASIC